MTNLSTGKHDAPAGSTPLGRILGLATAGLAVLTLLLGFTNVAASANFYEADGLTSLMLIVILAGGLLGALGALPRIAGYAPVAAVIVVTGFLGLLVGLVVLANRGGIDLAFGAYLVAFFALLTTVAAVGALLIEAGVISPQQRPSAQGGYGQPSSQYGQPSGASYGAAAGQFGAPQSGAPQSGAAQSGAPQSGGYGQGAGQPPSQGQGYSGSYGAPAQQQQQQFGQGQASYPQQGQPQTPYQQAPQYPSSTQYAQGDEEADDRTRAYTPPTQTFGSQPAEGEQPPGNQYGTPPQQ